MKSKNNTFLISGGGTGGHIFPAVAIANEIKSRTPDSNIHFVGAKDKMEMEKVPKAGYTISGLWISGIQRKLSVSNLLFPFKLISSLYTSYKIIKKHQPDAVIGTGGFASGPLVYMASKMGIPTFVQEQNAYPGITNKLLAKAAKVVCVAFPNMENYFKEAKVVLTGNPIRAELFQNVPTKEEARQFFGMDSSKKTILNIGGSLGSRTLNESIIKDIDSIKNSDTQWLWQTGKLDFEKSKEAAKGVSNVFVKDFIYEMKMAYAAADLVISRSGAIALSEMAVAAKAAILVPFPFAAEDHQTKNAEVWKNVYAGKIVKDKDSREQLIPLALEWVKNEAELKKASTQAKSLATPNAVKMIVDEIENYIR